MGSYLAPFIARSTGPVSLYQEVFAIDMDLDYGRSYDVLTANDDGYGPDGFIIEFVTESALHAWHPGALISARIHIFETEVCVDSSSAERPADERSIQLFQPIVV